MIWSAYMGLPLSLESVGAVLGLGEQKLKEGKDLIRYFCVPCKPTKVNGGRTRNMPSDVADVLKLRQQLAKSSVKNIRLCRTLYVPMAVPEVCSSFMVQTDLVDGRDALSSYRTCHKTT